MNVAWKTDTGIVREKNEDRLLVDQEHGIFLLADGLGGHNAGEVASELAVHVAHAFLRKEIAPATDGRSILCIMEKALCSAHRAIQEKAATDVQYHGMGTTLVELYIHDRHAYLCHAGDSRAYLFRHALERITRDHTVGNTCVERGEMESDKVPARLWHVLTQAVGTNNSPVPDKNQIELLQGDVLLVCTDGLTDMLTDVEIRDIVINHRGSPDTLVERLTGDAIAKGGKDNITVIAIEI